MAPPDVAGPRRHLRLFTPILAGATLRERTLACLAAFVGITITALACGLAFGDGVGAALIVAPMGASAVLVFAVPSSPLAQPWPVVGGNAISALVGIAVAGMVSDPALGAGLAVMLAIAAMSLTRSLHPPGGAAALTAVLGGPAVAGWGLLFPLVPVAANAVALVGVGIVFHRLAGRSYPHVVASPHGTADPPPLLRGIRTEDIDAALGTLGETFDIGRDDVARLLDAVERQTLLRAHATPRADEIMSRDVVKVEIGASPAEALALLLRHNIRILPVVDREGRLVGTVGLRELAAGGHTLGDVVSPARTARAGDPAVGLIAALTDGTAHAVVIVEDGRVVGLITQTDLLAALSRALAAPERAAA